jgi:hypothetical protein
MLWGWIEIFEFNQIKNTIRQLNRRLLLLFIIGIIIWIIKSKPRFKIMGRLIIGVLLTLVFVVGLQAINNAIFDPIFN